MPGTKCARSCFCVDCITCWFLFTRQLALALVSMLRGPHTGVRSGICRGAGAGIFSHPFSRCPLCWRSRRHPSCWCLRGCPSCWCLRGCPSCWCSCGCLAVMQAPVLLSCGRSSRRMSCCCAGIRVGICLAVVLAFVRASVVLPFTLASIVRAGVMYLSSIVWLALMSPLVQL